MIKHLWIICFEYNHGRDYSQRYLDYFFGTEEEVVDLYKNKKQVNYPLYITRCNNYLLIDKEVKND